MKANFILLTVIVCLALILAGVLIGQGPQRLYLIEGFSTRNYTFKIPMSIVKVNEVSHELLPVVQLSDETMGSDFILTNHERRVIVVGGPNITPTQLTVVRMDNPSVPQSFKFSFPGRSLLSAFLIDRPTGPITALLSVGAEGAHLSGVDLVSTITSDLPWDAIRTRRSEGWWEPGELADANRVVRSNQGKLVMSLNGNVVDMGLVAPKELDIQPDSNILFDANNDEVLILENGTERGEPSRGAAGRTLLAIYNKKTGNWHTEPFNGGGSSVRAFGSWVVVNEANWKVRGLGGPGVERPKEPEPESPGRLQRQKVLNPQDKQREQATVDSLFKNSPSQFAGVVHIYDANSGKKYQWSTLQGDTEVLLISGTTLYYRVNDTLVKAQIGKNSIENTQEILRDENIQLVHWAFLGP